MSRKAMRTAALRRYVVFRIKAIEFLDLNALRNSLRSKEQCLAPVPIPTFPAIRPGIFVSDSLRTVVLSYFCLFVDKSKDGMDVIDLWITLFPKHAKEVKEVWARIATTWPILRDFRDRVGFHADKPLKFFGARNNVRREAGKVDEAVDEFARLLKFFLLAESKELPDFEAALDSLLDELEESHKTPYQREQFKAYLMISGTRENQPEER